MDILYGTRDYYEIDNNNINNISNMNMNALGYRPQLATDYYCNIPLAEIKDDISTSPPTLPYSTISEYINASSS